MRNYPKVRSAIISVIILSTSCANLPSSDAPVTKISEEGYLAKNELLDAINLLAPPPKTGNALFRADEEAEQMVRTLRNTPRWTLAAQDAIISSPDAPAAFSCALGAPITAEATPQIHNLLRRARIDLKNSIEQIKEHYQRKRPFVVKNIASCFPADEYKLQNNGSFPSGHTATGWIWALILAELAPDHADLILRRGYAFGYSRLVCAVHWLSDVEAGFTLGAAITARLHAEPQFRHDLDNARAELTEIRKQELPPTRDCQFEASALAIDQFSFLR